MMHPTLFVGSLLAFTAAGVYGYVGWRLRGRVVSDDARLASRLFAVWWASLAASTAMTGTLSLLAATGFTNAPLWIAATILNLFLVCVALWGLMYYLAYVFTGRGALLVPLSAFYLFYYAYLVYLVTAAEPIAVEVGRWQTRLSYAEPITGPTATIALLLLVLPQILGAFAYLTLLGHVRDRSSRYRIAVVSVSIIVWFGSALFGAATDVNAATWWSMVSKVLGLAAALCILAAYVPPPFVQRMLGVRPVASG